jgi:hypothetical protein
MLILEVFHGADCSSERSPVAGGAVGFPHIQRINWEKRRLNLFRRGLRGWFGELTSVGRHRKA